MADDISKQYLANVIDYDKDIEPYRFIKIYAGVGSGKNMFVDKLIEGKHFKHADGSFVEPKHILLITSRRAKVNEQLNSDEVVYDPIIGAFDTPAVDWLLNFDDKYVNFYESPMVELPDLSGWGKQRVYKRSCVNTNAKIEKNLYEYAPFDAATHPWERFDMIIVDEVHALLADASYQSAPFYTRRLIEETLNRQSNCKVIVMTGSPQILENDHLFDDAHLIDKMDECYNIMPKRIEMISQEVARKKQMKMIRDGTCFVAFFNHIDSILSIVEKASKKQREHIVASFTNEQKRKQLEKKYESVHKLTIASEAYLANFKKLPDEVTAFLSTARNKEGINIENKNYHFMFTESHNVIDVIQMAGRLREQVDTLYIVVDSISHFSQEDAYEELFSSYPKTVEAINNYYAELCEQVEFYPFDDETMIGIARKYDSLEKYIDFIHAKFPYIRYDYFRNEFAYYAERAKSRAYFREQQDIYDLAVKSKKGLVQLVNQWFPGVECVVSAKLSSDVKAKVDAYLTDNYWLNKNLSPDDRAVILKDINKITGGNAKKLKPLLKKYGYQFDILGKHIDSPAIIKKGF